MKKNKVGRPKLKNKIYKKRMISISDEDYNTIKMLGKGNFSNGIRVALFLLTPKIEIYESKNIILKDVFTIEDEDYVKVDL